MLLSAEEPPLRHGGPPKMTDDPVAQEPAKKDDFVARIIDALVDLLETARDWLQQEAEATVREKVVLPIQRLGLTLASAAAAGAVLVIALIFFAVAFIIWLGELVGYAWAFFIIGTAFLIGSSVFLYIKVRLIQK
jgi:hypothetical protein